MSPDRLSDSDALMWRIEGDPVLRSPIVVVGVLDRPPDHDRLRASLRRAADGFPRLGALLVPGPPGGRPRWVPDPDFDVDHHVRRVRAAEAGGVETALAVAEPDAAAAFDPARPLWQLTVVDGLERGRAAFVLRFHHTITDGVGAVDLARQVLDTTRRGDGRVSAPATSGGAHRRGPGAVEQAAGALAAVGRAALDPVGSLRAAAKVARSVARLLAPARAPLSPLFVGRGIDRDLRVLEVPLDDLRAAAHAVDGTVNEVYLAAIGGALRDHHAAAGVELDAVRVTMPISIRTDDDGPGGNRFTPARFVLPVDDRDVVHRAQLAGALVRRWRAEPAVGMTPQLAAALDLLPAPLVRRAFAGMLRAVDVDAVDVPGLEERAFLAGARVERLWAFAPPTGAALSVTLLSYVDRACVGVACDRAAVQDPDRLVDCLDRALQGVRALGSREAVPA